MAPKKQIDPDELMIVNDSPGEECRIAILQNGHLEELFTERTATATNVGNIYKGRVTNVEPAIQAAFIDYGEGQNGFLHISDLHPKYFPGQERTERVGKKIPRRDRPPIQAALRRGDEILVQVLKEGIGTKGPTLTGYLSIPGRLLVIMPDMDRVGVSRKVEDQEKRREMREILDSLNLPDGFGFILRTAGYGKTKTELKRDAAYLMRLWKVMEKRMKSVGAPCELYTESDLLLRTVRDVLRPSIKAIVVDSESAFDRLSMFLRVVTPRSAPKVVRYHRPVPIFHAFDIERQIELIHSSEVPLPSGGRLVIDQTEALVAIDVNSGRSRAARDSETNAYETNVEAADEICRQLRLRDLGGLIVNDLIDMRSAKHRNLIEERFDALLKRDRAKATALPISEFGILEMTRQRMRPSIRKSHFMACPHCNGHGEIKSPEYVAADAARHAGFILQFERVHRVEMVCSPRVASVMLSAKRRELVRMEDATNKRIDVRVSDDIAADRVDYYAYDDRNADIDITRLPALKVPSLEDLEGEQLLPPVAPQAGLETRGEGSSGRRQGPADAAAMALAGDFDDDFEDFEDEESTEAASQTDGAISAAPAADGAPTIPGEARKGKRRRRRRGGRNDKRFDNAGALASSGDEVEGSPSSHAPAASNGEPVFDQTIDQPETAELPLSDGASTQDQDLLATPGGKRPRRRRGRRRRRGDRVGPDVVTPQEGISDSSIQSDQAAETADAVPGERDYASADDLPDAEAGNGAATPPFPSEVTGEGQGPPKRPRRRRGRRRGKGGQQPVSGEQAGSILQDTIGDSELMPSDSGFDAESPTTEPTMPTLSPSTNEELTIPGQVPGQFPGKKRRRRRRRGKGGVGGAGDESRTPWQASNNGGGGSPSNDNQRAPSPPPQPQAPAAPQPAQSSSDSSTSKPARKPRRALYRAGRVAVSPKAREGLADKDD